MTRTVAVVLLAGVVIAAGCAPPITARRADARRVHRHLTSNVLTTGELSQRTQNVLYNHDLVERYDDDPAGAIAALHQALIAGSLRPEETVALAELAFHYAEERGGPPYDLSAAVYAWLYLFPASRDDAPDRSDPYVRLAYDIYNRGVTAAFQTKKGERVELREGAYPVPFGAIDVTMGADVTHWGAYQLHDFVPVAELEVTGFPTYYRWSGLGAPLAAAATPLDPASIPRDLLAPRARVPVTGVLRLDDAHAQLASGRIAAPLELYPGFGESTITVAGRKVPLEAEPTAAIGLGLTNSPVWKSELRGFLGGFSFVTDRTRLVAVHPYEHGRIPVVFVHGTASSAGRWAQLFNELDNDPRIHSKYQFWFFSYETGNPIAYSAMLLRDALENAVAQLDPNGTDPALHRMVVIGHSQGGLLTKTTAVESGDRFWQNVSDKPFADMKMRDETRKLLQRTFFIHPLPFVQRVIFIATPHHGSYVAGNWLAHQVARLVQMPLQVTNVLADVATGNREALVVERMRGAPTAVDNMTPGNPFVKTLVELPVAPGVHAHSIIAAKDGVASDTANDGVVQYKSAHIEGVDSEVVVRSAHSCQTNPHTIAEVRRILLLHAGEQAGTGQSPPQAPSEGAPRTAP